MGVGDFIGDVAGAIGDAAGYIGGHLDGGITSEGKGARAHVDIVDSKVIPKTRIASWNLSGFKDGGRVGGEDKAALSRAKLAALHQQHGTSQERAADANRRAGGATDAAGSRQGGRQAPTRGGTASGSKAAAGHVATGRGPSVVGGAAFARRKHEISPGIACPSCASGITTPVR